MMSIRRRLVRRGRREPRSSGRTISRPEREPRSNEAIEATLTADGHQVLLVIETWGMPLDLVGAYGVGYQIHAENLAAHLAGRERVDSKARWDELEPAYRDLAANLDRH